MLLSVTNKPLNLKLSERWLFKMKLAKNSKNRCSIRTPLGKWRKFNEEGKRKLALVLKKVEHSMRHLIKENHKLERKQRRISRILSRSGMKETISWTNLSATSTIIWSIKLFKLFMMSKERGRRWTIRESLTSRTLGLNRHLLTIRCALLKTFSTELY